MEYLYGIGLTVAGVYAILIGHNLLPSKQNNQNEKKERGRHKNWIQYTIAGIVLIYFGASNIYSIIML